GSPSGPRGWTWCSARTTSGRFLRCLSGPGCRPRRRSRSWNRWSGSPPYCPCAASPRTRPGWPSRWAATTPARSASCRACAAGGRGEVLAEVTALASEGVLEVTLLGQNVNSYGAGFGDRQAFSKLLRACGEVDGLERVRFTSPHPRDFTADVIAAMAETPNVMPSLHMPLQSGSDAVLRAMRRSYRQEKVPRIPAPVRAAIPGAASPPAVVLGVPRG